MQPPDPRSDAPAPPPVDGRSVDEFALLSSRMKAELAEALGTLRRALVLQRQALGLSLFDFGLKAAVALALVAAGVVLAVASALVGLFALQRGLAQWTAGAWWSDLVLAAIVLALLALAAFGARRLVHRSVLARAKRRLAAAHSAAEGGAP